MTQARRKAAVIIAATVAVMVMGIALIVTARTIRPATSSTMFAAQTATVPSPVSVLTISLPGVINLDATPLSFDAFWWTDNGDDLSDRSGVHSMETVSYTYRLCYAPAGGDIDDGAHTTCQMMQHPAHHFHNLLPNTLYRWHIQSFLADAPAVLIGQGEGQFRTAAIPPPPILSGDRLISDPDGRLTVWWTSPSGARYQGLWVCVDIEPGCLDRLAVSISYYVSPEYTRVVFDGLRPNTPFYIGLRACGSADESCLVYSDAIVSETAPEHTNGKRT